MMRRGERGFTTFQTFPFSPCTPNSFSSFFVFLRHTQVLKHTVYFFLYAHFKLIFGELILPLFPSYFFKILRKILNNCLRSEHW